MESQTAPLTPCSQPQRCPLNSPFNAPPLSVPFSLPSAPLSPVAVLTPTPHSSLSPRASNLPPLWIRKDSIQKQPFLQSSSATNDPPFLNNFWTNPRKTTQSATNTPEKTIPFPHKNLLPSGQIPAQQDYLSLLSPQQNSPKKTQSSLYSSPFKRYQPEGDDYQPKPISLPSTMFPFLPQINQFLNQAPPSPQSAEARKLYTEQQITMLKKELEFESKGEVSKSTEFHSDMGYVTKISFKCKFSPTCPYLSELRYEGQRNSQQQKLYKLFAVNLEHQQECQLNEEDIRYNIVTRNIDLNMAKITEIISRHSVDIKPKSVLEIFAQEQGEESSNFIYRGIDSRMKKRAVKKYFDNSVAKARNILKKQTQ